MRSTTIINPANRQFGRAPTRERHFAARIQLSDSFALIFRSLGEGRFAG